MSNGDNDSGALAVFFFAGVLTVVFLVAVITTVMFVHDTSTKLNLLLDDKCHCEKIKGEL